MRGLVLASASPRRREILETLGVSFEVVPSELDETQRTGEGAHEYALRIAREKALSVSARVDAFVLGADTIVVVDDCVLGKPLDDDDARAMLKALAGRWHEVITAVALAREASVLEVFCVATRVLFGAMGAARIDRYVATGEGRDKAGAYAVQGIASGLIERIEGSYGNVVGLPAAETIALLERHGAIAEWP